MIDAIILGTLFISIIIGWFRGAVKEVCSIISWFGSGYLAWKLFPIGLDLVREHISQPLLANIVTGVSLFVVFLIVLSLLTFVFSTLIQRSVFSIADKFCGGLFGLFRGLLIVSVAEFGATYFIFKEPPAMFQQSMMLPYVKHLSQMMFLLLPDNIQSGILGHLSKEKVQALITTFGGKLSNSLFAKNALTNSSKSSNAGVSSNTNKPIENVSPDQINRASELANLGVKKNEPNPNLNKSTRSDLDKLIDQYI